jgi:hypothetical protein
MGTRFSKLDDLLTLVVTDAAGQHREIPLFWTPDGQEHVIENVEHYLVCDGAV